jgi:hypothetical protein
MKMKKTSLTLVAALAATTVLGPAHGTSYDYDIDQEKTSQMGDRECREHVVEQARKAERYDVALNVLSIARSGIHMAEDLTRGHADQNETWYGMPTRKDYALTVGKGAQGAKILGKLAVRTLPDSQIMSHAMRAAESIGENNGDLGGAAKTMAKKTAVWGAHQARPESKIQHQALSVARDVATLATMGEEHAANKAAYADGEKPIRSLRETEKERARKAEQRIKEIDAKVRAAVARYCGEGQAVKVLGASEMGLSISNYRWDPKNFQLPEPSGPTLRPARPTDVRAPEYSFSPTPVSRRPTSAPVKRCWREIKAPGCL